MKPHPKSKKIKSMSELRERQVPYEHPEDKACRLDSEARAAENIDDFIATHQGELKELIQTYGDAEAEEKLVALREQFWAFLPYVVKKVSPDAE